MTPQEAAALLTICAGFDNRKPDADQAQALALALEGRRFIDCRDAIVVHYQRTRDWIMPFDVISGVKRVRSKRIMDFGPLPDPPAGLTEGEYAVWLRDTTRAIGDGELLPEARPQHVGRNLIRELDQAGLRVNTLPTERIATHAERLRETAREARAERQAKEKPEPEPLLGPGDLSREEEPADA